MAPHRESYMEGFCAPIRGPGAMPPPPGDQCRATLPVIPSRRYYASLRLEEGTTCNRPGLLAYLIPQTHEERMRSDEAKGKAEGRRRTASE